MPYDQTTARKDSNGCMVTFLALLLTTLTVLLAVGAAVGSAASSPAATPENQHTIR